SSGDQFSCRFVFLNDPATTEIYTLSLHDALPILREKLAAHGTVHSLWMSATLNADPLDTVDHRKPAAGWRIHKLEAEDMDHLREIGRASCRERVGIEVVVGVVYIRRSGGQYP